MYFPCLPMNMFLPTFIMSDFSFLELNSAYHQIPLLTKSEKATAFRTPFWLFGFTKLPMGISMACQALFHVVDFLFCNIMQHRNRRYEWHRNILVRDKLNKHKSDGDRKDA